jgi:DNA (cytosine-5)-methyltransferase 1
MRFANKSKNVANTASLRQSGQGQHEQPINSAQGCNWQTNYVESIGTPNFWQFEPAIPRVADGVAARVDRLKAIGNGQVPLCAATAWRILSES